MYRYHAFVKNEQGRGECSKRAVFMKALSESPVPLKERV